MCKLDHTVPSEKCTESEPENQSSTLRATDPHGREHLDGFEMCHMVI